MSGSIVIALPKIEDAKKIRSILQNHGYPVASVCNTVAGALAGTSELDYGILICGYHFADGFYRDILEDLPTGFELVFLASRRYIESAPMGLLSVELPMKTSDLVNTVEMIFSAQERRRKKEKRKPKSRSEKEQNCEMAFNAAERSIRGGSVSLYSEEQYGYRNQYGGIGTDDFDADLR